MRDDVLDGSEARFLLRRWGNGESSLPLVEHLIESGHNDEAAALARLALAYPDCPDTEALHEALYRIAAPPDEYMELLVAFAKDPDEERWQALMRFVPEEVFYQRLRTTTSVLMRLGCDADALFRCVAQNGMTPDLFDLAKSGGVKPETIETRAQGSPAAPAWLSLAALASFARGDRFNTIRYLKEATADERTAFYAWAAISEIRDQADEEFKAELAKAGVPQV